MNCVSSVARYLPPVFGRDSVGDTGLAAAVRGCRATPQPHIGSTRCQHRAAERQRSVTVLLAAPGFAGPFLHAPAVFGREWCMSDLAYSVMLIGTFVVFALAI